MNKPLVIIALCLLALSLSLCACGGGEPLSPLGTTGYNGANCDRPDWKDVPDCVPAVALPEPAPRPQGG